MTSTNFEETLSYDDVLLLPSYADMLPSDADVTTEILPNVRLNIPIMSAAMDTVTEDRLAIALGLEGGVGVIHRNLTPEEQAHQVSIVKRYLNWIIENPLTVDRKQRVSDVWDLMSRYNISGLPVLENDRLCGIITSRDMRFCRDYSKLVEDVMTPNPVVEVGTPDIESAQHKFDEYKIEKLPVVDKENRLTGLITVKDMEKHSAFPRAALDESGRLLVGAAVSPNDIDVRMPLLRDARVDFVVLDTAHGDSANVVNAIKKIKANYSVPVVGGNVATREGTRRLIDAGADAVKVGVGPGSICTTRVVAGIGVAQFSAVFWAAEEAASSGVPIIADGGIKYSGDIAKAIAAGASTVMIGNLFAGLKEAPGREIIYEGRIFKAYRGMGSIGAIRKGSGDRYQMNDNEEPVPEGVEGRVPYKGELKPYLHQLVTGLKKGMGYCGCRSIDELRAYKKFVRITAAGLKEGHVHDVAVTQEPPNYSR
ncbi:MAG: IMP dehydrogenase [Spirochaetaceae bacterium]|nr:MAG: IMP dehydrogenase [Spirochaetaceae bacterium]